MTTASATAATSAATITFDSPFARPLADRWPPWALLASGLLLTVLTGPRWGIALLAWLAPVPYLVYARRARGGMAWIWLFGTFFVGHCIQCAAIATPPVPLAAVLGFGPPLAILRFGAVGISEAVRRHLGEGAGIAAFVSSTVVLDWVGHGALELGAWMATANSQVDSLPLLQLASIAGLDGLGALMAWTAATVAVLAGVERPFARVRGTATLAGLLALGLLWAALRLDAQVAGRNVAVAAVVTAVGPDERGLPSAETLARNNEQLFARTRVAAGLGARLVVWNELATIIARDEEGQFVARARTLARELGIDLVLAFGVLESRDPLLFDNKYLFIADSGAILDTYQKHHPVPGEPSIRGFGPLRVLDRPYGKVGGAICYDYDFPAMAREHARAGAELVVVPSSDWRGIDPIHTLMARMRAVEGGFSLVRSARWSASGAFDAHGRIRAWLPAADHRDGVMVARVPVGRTATLAAALGDTPVVLAATLLGSLWLLTIRARRIPAARSTVPLQPKMGVT
jgi:apolipoprotein N-acyltransferase